MDPLLEQLQQTIRVAMAGLSEEQLSRHAPGKWCAAEVLEHLYLTYTGTIKGFERVFAAGAPNARAATWSDRAKAFVVVGLGYMPSGRKAPETARPKGIPRQQVLADILAKITEMDDVIRRCEDKLGSGKLLDHPILGPLDASQWRKFHLVHGRHHANQIHQLKARAPML